MNVSLNLTDALIIGLIVMTIILVIYLIVLAARLKETLRKVDDILDDANRISKIAAEKTEVIDGVIDNAAGYHDGNCGNGAREFIADRKGGQCGYRSGSHSVSSSRKNAPESEEAAFSRANTGSPEKIDFYGTLQHTE